MALLTGLSATLGGLANTKAARTSTSNTNTTGTSAGSNTSSSAPTYNPLQTGLQGSVAGTLQNEMNNGINTAPMATAGTSSINSTYQGIGDRLSQSLSSRGFGNSGASGSAALQTELGRAGSVGNLQSSLQGYALQQQQNAVGQAANFSTVNPGNTASSSGTTTNSGTSNNTSVAPGSVAAGALQGGLGSLLQQLDWASSKGAFN